MSSLYNAGKVAFLTKQIDWVNDDIRACLVDTSVGTSGYVFDATHQFKSSLTGKIVADMTASLAGKTVSATAVCDANDVIFPVVNTPSVEAVVIYKYTGTASTETLIAFLDGFTPIEGNGNQVTITWSNGANKIFKL